MVAFSQLLSFVHSKLALPQLGGVGADAGEVFVAGIGDLAEGEIPRRGKWMEVHPLGL